MSQTAEQTLETGKVLDSFHEHLETVCPGQPASFTEACTPGDRIWQGDLGLTIVDKIPEDYVEVELKGEERSKKLVPGFQPGSMHCLEKLEGVKMWRHKEWGVNEELTQGPLMLFAEPNVITHPKHGDVSVPAGFMVLCTYQREYDAMQKRERRSRD